jgi:uncharacterized surface protein with fasciclin (FAS1) repeats
MMVVSPPLRVALSAWLALLASGAVAEAPRHVQKTIAESVSGAKDQATFAAAMKAAGLADKLASNGPFTVFVPNDLAFRKLPPGTVDNLLKAENRPQLETVMTYHVVQGALTSKDLQAKITAGGGKAEFTTLQGEPLTVQRKGKTLEIVDAKGDVAALTGAGLPQTNGVIHIVGTVLLP